MVWEPACGEGNLVCGEQRPDGLFGISSFWKSLGAAGFDITCSDILASMVAITDDRTKFIRSSSYRNRLQSGHPSTLLRWPKGLLQAV